MFFWFCILKDTEVVCEMIISTRQPKQPWSVSWFKCPRPDGSPEVDDSEFISFATWVVQPNQLPQGSSNFSRAVNEQKKNESQSIIKENGWYSSKIHSAWFLLTSLVWSKVLIPGTGQETVKAPCHEISIPELFQKLLSVWGVFELQAW